MIPRPIHQIWMGDSGGAEPPPRFVENAETWRVANPGWGYRLWGAEEVRALFEEHRPDLLPLYRSCPYFLGAHWKELVGAGAAAVLATWVALS